MLTRVLRGVPLDALDGRSAVAVALKRAREELLDHLGGADEATTVERILVEEAAKARVICAAVGDYILRQESGLVREGELLPVVEAHARLLNNLAKVLKLLGMKRAAREVTAPTSCKHFIASAPRRRATAPTITPTTTRDDDTGAAGEAEDGRVVGFGGVEDCQA